jgi:rod shape-determining protein MreD
VVFLALILMVLFLAVFQTQIPFGWLPLDLVLMQVVFAGLHRGRGEGLISGLVAGITLDLLLSPFLGLRLIPLALTGFLADCLETGMNREQKSFLTGAMVGLTLLHDLFLTFTGWFLGLDQGGWMGWFFLYVFLRCITHFLLAVPFFGVLGFVFKRRIFQKPFSQAPSVISSLPPR